MDMRADVGADVVTSINRMPMFRDGSASVIYLCHGLEHFRNADVNGVLSEYHRILMQHGMIYLAVPDFGKIASEYVFGMLGLKSVHAAIVGGQEYTGNTHYSVWDKTMLTRALIDAGFVSPQEYDPLEFLPAGFRDYSSYMMNGECMSLNMRASC